LTGLIETDIIYITTTVRVIFVPGSRRIVIRVVPSLGTFCKRFLRPYFLRKHFSFISLDTYVALKYGPVASNSLDILNKNKVYLDNFSNNELMFLEKIKKINDSKRIIDTIGNDLLSKNEMASIDKSIQLFHGKPLIELSHDYPE